MRDDVGLFFSSHAVGELLLLLLFFESVTGTFVAFSPLRLHRRCCNLDMTFLGTKVVKPGVCVGFQIFRRGQDSSFHPSLAPNSQNGETSGLTSIIRLIFLSRTAAPLASTCSTVLPSA